MRIAHLADLHLTERPCRSDVPLEEQEEILGRIAKVVNDSAVDAVLIAGDCYDGASTPRERLALARFVRSLHHRVPPFERGPVEIIYGNHDAPFDLDLLPEYGHEDRVHDRPGVYAKWWRDYEWGRDYDLAVATWPRVRSAEGYAAIVRGLRAQCGEKCVLLAHFDALDAKLDGGQDSTGKVDAAISMHDLEEMHWTYVAGGHYHMRQLFPWGGYSGGIRPMHHGDDSRKGVVIVDLETGKREEIDCAGYSLVTVDVNVDLDDEHPVAVVAQPEAGPRDRVRIRYTIAEENQTRGYERAQRVAKMFEKCRSVSIEPEVIPTVRVRAPEIAAAKTDEDVLRAYLATTGGTRVEEIVEKSEAVK